MAEKHEHFMYVLGFQPRCAILDIKLQLDLCLEMITLPELENLGVFHRITGTRHFCTYVLVCNKSHLKPASDPKLYFPCVSIPVRDIFLVDKFDYVKSSMLTVLANPCIRAQASLTQLDRNNLQQ